MNEFDECENCHGSYPARKLHWIEDEVSGDWLECDDCAGAHELAMQQDEEYAALQRAEK